MYTISHATPQTPIHRPEYAVPFEEKGWVYLGEWITTSEPEGCSWPVEVIRAIRKFDPAFTPIWIKTAFRSPAGTVEKFGRHGFARTVPVLHGKHLDMKVHTTSYGVNAGRKPNVFLDVWEDRSNRPIADIPVGAYLPFDWRTYDVLHVAWQTQRGADEADRDARDHHRAISEARAARLAVAQADADYRWKQEMPYFKRLIDSVSSLELNEINAPIEPERKPFVHVKGNA